MPMTKEELQERAYLVRIHESNCKIEHPTPEELNFRLAIMKSLGSTMKLREMRTVQIGAPGTPAQRPGPTQPPKSNPSPRAPR